MTDEWSYKINKKYWENKEELATELTERVADVKKVAYLLKAFLEEETLPFKLVGEIEIHYSNKCADTNLNEHWGKAFLIIPVMKRGFLKSPKYDKLEGKHYLKIRITLGQNELHSWQEHCWHSGSLHRWYMEMEQIKAWKEVLDKFNASLPTLKTEVGNPSSR